MGRSSLAEVLIPFHSRKAYFRWHLTFVNSDGCKIHVPLQTSNVRALRSRNQKELMNDLLRKMTCAFADEAPEFGPLLKPDTEFFLKTRVIKPLQTVFRRTHSRLERSLVRTMDLASKNKAAVDFPTNPGDLCHLEEFTKAFVNKRYELNLSQKQVAASLKAIYGINRSSTFISRIERLDVGLNHYLRVYPVLLQWLKDTEDPKICDSIMRAAIGSQSANGSTPVHSNQCNRPKTPLVFAKQRSRKILKTEVKKALEEVFVKNRHPSLAIINKLADKFDIDVHTIRIWFYNRRAIRNTELPR